MKARFVQVDAFADRAFAGNPAAVMPLDAWLDDATLQAIAAENNLSETAFVVPARGEADYDLRWFTPAAEVELCGHATLASGHVLLTDDPAAGAVRFATRRAGMLIVTRTSAGYSLDLPAWKPAPAQLPSVAAGLGGDPVAMLRHPRGYAVAVYASEAEVRALTPDFRALAREPDTLQIATARGDSAAIVSRAFAPSAGIDEDPVTGSAHAVIAPYWVEMLGRTRFTAYQASARGGHMTCEVLGDRVLLEGRCATVIEGVFSLPSPADA